LIRALHTILARDERLPCPKRKRRGGGKEGRKGRGLPIVGRAIPNPFFASARERKGRGGKGEEREEKDERPPSTASTSSCRLFLTPNFTMLFVEEREGGGEREGRRVGEGGR